MAYQKPLLKEIVATLHLRERSLAPPDFFELVPRLLQRGFSKVEIPGMPVPVSVGPAAIERPAGQSMLEQLSPQIRCWTEDNSRLVQLSVDRISVNHVVKNEYLGWQKYRQQAFDVVFEAFTQTKGTPAVQAVEMVAIDELQVPSDGFTLGRYLNCGGNKLPRWYHDKSASCDITMGLGFVNLDGFNYRYSIRTRHKDSQASVKIESAFVQSVPAGRTAIDVLEELHAMSNAHFEDLITDYTRTEVMGGAR